MKKPSPSGLRKAITEAARQAFADLRAAHPEEAFYAYALYTNPEADYIAASANTEEGLICRARHYNAKEKKGILEHARRLRWNTPDWAYHCVGEDHFARAQELLDRLWGKRRLGAEESEDQGRALLDLFVEALKALDDEGFFGRGKTRQQVTLLLMMGDQEQNLLLNCAKKLNPPKVFEEFSKPFLHPTVGKLKGIGSRKVYETSRVVVSANGKLLVCASSSESGWPTIFAFALPTRKEVLRLTINETIALQGIGVSPDAATIVAGWESLANDKRWGIRSWDVRTKKIRCGVAGSESIRCFDLSPDGMLVASGAEQGSIALWDVQTGKLIRRLRGHRAGVQCIRFSPAGGILASSDREKGVRFWDCASAREIGKIAAAGDALAFSPDGRYLAVASGFAEHKNDVSIWEVHGRKQIARLDAVDNSKFQVLQGEDDFNDCQPSAVAFSPDARFLVVARSWPGSAVLWDWKQKLELIWMDPNYESLDEVAFLPDGITVAIAGRPMRGPPLLLWDVSAALKRK